MPRVLRVSWNTFHLQQHAARVETTKCKITKNVQLSLMKFDESDEMIRNVLLVFTYNLSFILPLLEEFGEISPSLLIFVPGYQFNKYFIAHITIKNFHGICKHFIISVKRLLKHLGVSQIRRVFSSVGRRQIPLESSINLLITDNDLI